MVPELNRIPLAENFCPTQMIEGVDEDPTLCMTCRISEARNEPIFFFFFFFRNEPILTEARDPCKSLGHMDTTGGSSTEKSC